MFLDNYTFFLFFAVWIWFSFPFFFITFTYLYEFFILMVLFFLKVFEICWYIDMMRQKAEASKTIITNNHRSIYLEVHVTIRKQRSLLWNKASLLKKSISNWLYLSLAPCFSVSLEQHIALVETTNTQTNRKYYVFGCINGWESPRRVLVGKGKNELSSFSLT